MTDMQDREKAFETKYALDQEVMFRIEARAVKLFGLWLAGELGIEGDGARTLAGNLVSANLDEPGFEDVKRAARPVLEEKAYALSDADMDNRLMQFMEQARIQITEEKA